ncbi:MAG: class I SAM-dependent methyltransferase [Planctomycetaceae bacterium]
MPPTVSHSSSHAFLPAVARNWKALIQEPAQVASICPSLPALTERLARDPVVSDARLLVEVGPGNGETTRALLDHMKSSSQLLAIEKTAAFIEALYELDDPRLIVRQGNAIHLEEYLRQAGLERPDVIISGIPFSSLPADTARSLIASIHNALRPGGAFIAYQFRNEVVRFARPLFGEPQVEWIWLNLPPLRIFRWTKGGYNNA